MTFLKFYILLGVMLFSMYFSRYGFGQTKFRITNVCAALFFSFGWPLLFVMGICYFIYNKVHE